MVTPEPIPTTTFMPIETPGAVPTGALAPSEEPSEELLAPTECPPGQVIESATGQCPPMPTATGGGFGPGIISAGLTLGPGAIQAPMLGRYRVMNLH